MRISKFHLEVEVRSLCDLARENCGPTHPLVVAARRLIHDRSTKEQLAEFRELFYLQPESEQRQILNGWNPCAIRATRSHELEMIADQRVERIISVFPTGSAGVVHAHQTWRIGESFGYPVEVAIQEGAMLADVLNGLAEMYEYLHQNWPALIASDHAMEIAKRDVAREGSDYESGPRKKGIVPASQAAPTAPARNKSSMEPAAA